MSTSFKHVELTTIANVYSGYAFKSADLAPEGEFPVVKIANIQNKTVLKDCVTSLPASLMSDKLEKYRLRHGDVLVAMTGAGSVGKFGRMRTVDQPYLVNQRVGIIRAMEGRVDPDYLYHVLSLDEYERMLYAYGLGAGQPNVSPAQVGALEVPLASPCIQRKIASILSAYDDLIENNTRRIAILEEMAQAIYREWFVNFRFPGHENVKLLESTLGMIPEGWDVVTLKEMYPTSSGGTPSRTKDEYYNGGTINWVKTKELKDSFLWNTEEKITELGLKNSSAKVYPKHTVLMAMYGATIGQLGILGSESATNQACCAFRVHDSKFGYPFLFLYLLRNRTGIISLGAGAAQQNVSQDVIREIELAKPPLKLVQQFDKLVSPTLEQIFTIQKVMSNLRTTRDLLLPKLISGQLDVEDLDIDMGLTAEELQETKS